MRNYSKFSNKRMVRSFYLQLWSKMVDHRTLSAMEEVREHKMLCLPVESSFIIALLVPISTCQNFNFEFLSQTVLQSMKDKQLH